MKYLYIGVAALAAATQAPAQTQVASASLADLSLEQLRAFSPLTGEDVFEVLTLEGSVAARDHVGGTAPRQVRAAIARVRTQLEK